MAYENHPSDTPAERLTRIDQRVQSIEEKWKWLEIIMEGDQRSPGLLMKFDRIEQFILSTKWLIRVAIAAFIVQAAGGTVVLLLWLARAMGVSSI